MSRVAKPNKYEVFESWLRKNGAQFDMLELREYDVKDVCSDEEIHSGSNDKEIAEEKKEPPASKRISSISSNRVTTAKNGDEDSEMRGVHAKVDIPPNQICVSIPRKCLITVEMGQATEIGQAILNSDLELDAPKHVFLMIFLLWDRKVNGKNSFFKPYYDILPKTLSNMPIFWSEEELAYLEGSYLLAQIADRNEAIEDDYHTICNVAPQLADIATLEEFKWARMCVCSRNFGLQIDGNRTSALVPHADMLNHYRPRETKWTFDDYRQAFTITSLQNIPAGSQVYDSYGQKCNHRFLLNYGFAVEDNLEVDGFCPNEVPVELGVMPDDPLFDAKYDFWTRGENTTSSFGNSIMHLGGIGSHFESLTNPNLSAMRNNSMSSLSTNAAPSIKRIRVCVSNNENTRILFSMLRVIVADESELRVITSSAASLVTSSPNLSRAMLGLSGTSGLYRTCRDIRCPISLRNERAAMDHLLGVTARALRMYPTTLSQDIVDLLDEGPFPRFSNKRHAKIQISGEKEVLHHFAEWARTALEVMDVIERELYNTPWNNLDTTQRQFLDFSSLIQSMEDDENENTKHHTIVRYCADVLGALRREEKKRLMRNSNMMMQNIDRNSMSIGRGSLNNKGNTKG